MCSKRRWNLALASRRQASGSSPRLRDRVGDREQDVADLVLETHRISGVELCAQLGQFLRDLVEHQRRLLPVEADAGGTGAQLGGARQGGQAERDAGEGAMLGAGVTLGRLVVVPGHAGIPGRLVAEDVRMPPHHLVGDQAGDGGEVEAVLRLAQAGVVDDLEQQVAELVRKGRPVAAGDGVGDLIGFLYRVGRDGVEGLRLIPGAAGGWVAEGGHDVQQPGELLGGIGNGAGHRSRVL